jgi:light-regulated signal transduction histidine kinase (bacteriophytochrome)
MTLLRGIDAVERVFGLDLPDHRRKFDFAVNMSGRSVIIEAEPCDTGTQPDTASTIRAMISRLDDRTDEKALLHEGARQVRALTEFDRVMVYRFEADGSGTVVAEAARSGIGSFLDLRYPASDIPLQARKLYLRTLFRIIADVGAPPAPIDPRTDKRDHPLDLSLSVLRAVSPIHIEYLKNMGVHASMSISIVIEGRLWGLFVCHHYDGPRLPAWSGARSPNCSARRSRSSSKAASARRWPATRIARTPPATGCWRRSPATPPCSTLRNGWVRCCTTPCPTASRSG